MNTTNITGNLTREAFYSDKGQTTVAKFTVAVDSGRKNKNGNSLVDYVPVTAFDKLADNIHKYTTKGSRVAIQGRLSTSMVEDKSGVKQFRMTVVVKEVEFEDTIERYEELKQKNTEKSDKNTYSPKDEDNSEIKNTDLPWL